MYFPTPLGMVAGKTKEIDQREYDEEANKKDDYGAGKEEDESWCGSISTYHSEEERLLKYISFNSVLA